MLEISLREGKNPSGGYTFELNLGNSYMVYIAQFENSSSYVCSLGKNGWFSNRMIFDWECHGLLAIAFKESIAYAYDYFRMNNILLNKYTIDSQIQMNITAGEWLLRLKQQSNKYPY